MTTDPTTVLQALAAELGREPSQAEIAAALAANPVALEPSPQEPSVVSTADAAQPAVQSGAASPVEQQATGNSAQSGDTIPNQAKLDAAVAEAAKLEEQAKTEAALLEQAKQEAAGLEPAQTPATAAPEQTTVEPEPVVGPKHEYSISAVYQLPGAGSEWTGVDRELKDNLEEFWGDLNEHAQESIGETPEKKVGHETTPLVGAPATNEWQASLGVPMDAEKDFGRVELGADAMILGAAAAVLTAGIAAKAWDNLSARFSGGAEASGPDTEAPAANVTPEPEVSAPGTVSAAPMSPGADQAPSIQETATQSSAPEPSSSPEKDLEAAAPADPALGPDNTVTGPQPAAAEASAPNEVAADSGTTPPALGRDEMVAYALNHLRDPVTYPSLGTEMDQRLAPFQEALVGVDDQVSQQLAADPSFCDVSDLYRDSEYQQVYDSVIDMYTSTDDYSYLYTSTSVEPAILESLSDSGDLGRSAFEHAGLEVTGLTVGTAGSKTGGIGASGL